MDRRSTQETPKDDPDYDTIDDSNAQAEERIATEVYCSLKNNSSTQPSVYTQLEVYLTET